MYSLT